MEINGLHEGIYPLWVDSLPMGNIVVAADDDGDDTLKGKLRFSDPQKEDREHLDFDPRGKWVEVYEGTTRIFDVLFPE